MATSVNAIRKQRQCHQRFRAVIQKKNHRNNIMEYLPLTLPDQMLQVHKVLHMLQHLEMQLRHYSDFPVQVLFLETALNKENKVAKVISHGS